MMDGCQDEINQPDHCRPQVDPKHGKDSVTDQVIQDYIKRREFGVKKYGTELQSHNGRHTLVDAYQEALDLTLYIKQEIMEKADYVAVIVELSGALTELRDWYSKTTGLPAVNANKALKFMADNLGNIE